MQSLANGYVVELLLVLPLHEVADLYFHIGIIMQSRFEPLDHRFAPIDSHDFPKLRSNFQHDMSSPCGDIQILSLIFQSLKWSCEEVGRVFWPEFYVVLGFDFKTIILLLH